MARGNDEKSFPARDILAATALAIGGTYAILWLVTHPDVVRKIHLRAVLRFRRIAYGQADGWRSLADKAGTYYQRVNSDITG